MREREVRHLRRSPRAQAERVPLPAWVPILLGAVAVALVPWTLWLTFSLPSRHTTEHYDLAWVGFDIALVSSFALTAGAALRWSAWLEPAAAATGTLLLCDAWFDVVTTGGGSEWQAVLEACFAELPLAGVCAWIVWDAQRFRETTILRYAASYRRMRGREDHEERPAA
jgi:hypothetical protein